MGSPCRGSWGAAFFLFPQGKWQLLIRWGTQGPGPQSTRPRPLTQWCFPSTHTAPPAPYQASGWQSPLPGNAVLSARSARGPCGLIALGPLPPVSANISGGLQLRFCFSSLADVCFNLIKQLIGLSGRMRASVGRSPGGWWERLGVPWAPHPGLEARQGGKDQAWFKLRWEKSPLCL